MLYPLRFKEILRDYGFGNRWIAQAFAKQGLPENHRLAETWEVCDRPGESSVVLNGAFAGQSLHELIDRYDEGLLGSEILSRSGRRFPLLIKFLDVSQVLGAQAHHNDELAARYGLPDPGKTEGWYMLQTRPGAAIRCGQITDQVSRESLREALWSGSVRDLMREHAVQPGDAFLLYAGTMHYSAGGELFYEIMQNSNVYISLNRPDPQLPREEQEKKVQLAVEGVHLEPGFNCRIDPVTIQEGPNQRQFVMVCQYFAVERLDLNAAYQLDGRGRHFYVLSQIEGTSAVTWSGGAERLLPGHTCLIPAGMGPVSLVPSQGCAVLKAYVPDLESDILQPLRAAGVEEKHIIDLGGQTSLNPLNILARGGYHEAFSNE